eukprot:CAMPEP_0196805550 /NCGR_PEP_ID=MMETSP1362-20130617/5340_1 /TAXON_ID=163516 /ORGANISM="Leptocylindrus danicus, Strain CCMP1856" /LENGTH=398 /DNA_ID=CAMNT_0042178559 /DNA_START=82 /DNA_END=1278 /DNA_ORIENTATION=+
MSRREATTHLLLRPQSRYNSSAASNRSLPKPGFLSDKAKSRFRRLANFLKVVRVPVLAISLYGLGYQKGVIDYARNPHMKDLEILTGVLESFETVDIERPESDSVKNKQVQRVGKIILECAFRYVRDELEKSKRKCIDELSKDTKTMDTPLTTKAIEDAFKSNEKVEFWSEAAARLSSCYEWKCVLIHSAIPNAFVSEMLPSRIFVTTAMIEEFIENDDELGLVLGHEISHLIHGHCSGTNASDLMLRAIEMLVLALDPFDGIASLALMGAIASIRDLMSAAASREHEHEADEMGIKIAAMACFDTRKASKVFLKMYQKEKNGDGDGDGDGNEGPTLRNYFSSHPPSDERFKFLQEASTHENATKYMDTHCAEVKSEWRQSRQSMKNKKGWLASLRLV